MHWAIDANLLDPLIPSQLSIDTFDGAAWIGVIPFTMWGIRASFLPSLPGTGSFHELNVRTYVHFEGVPGVWFFSLDAASNLAVWAARQLYRAGIFHQPWPLRSASLGSHQSTMIESLGIAQPAGEPLLHYAESIAVDIWPLRKA